MEIPKFRDAAPALILTAEFAGSFAALILGLAELMANPVLGGTFITLGLLGVADSFIRANKINHN